MNESHGMRGRLTTGRSVGRGLAVFTVAALVVSACGSDDTSESGSSGAAESSVVVPGALENTVTTDPVTGAATGGVCRDWPAGTTVVPCAVDAMGPGGGRVFHDAGSVQPWGRFLEVAPQDWNGTLVKCPGIGGSSCGTSDPDSIPRSTSDAGPDLDGYFVCAEKTLRLLEGEAGATGRAIGDGRRNTEVLSQTPYCVDPWWLSGSEPKRVPAVELAPGYRGGDLPDWYLPSLDELLALCRYEGRNAIGGFASRKYLSSASYYDEYQNERMTNFRSVAFGDDCLVTDDVGAYQYSALYVRPIRAFA
jgi:hypothetical protein